MNTTYNLKYFLLIAIGIFISFGTYAAVTGTIKGVVTDVNNQPVEYATAALLYPATHEIVKGQVCNDKGEFTFNKVNAGEYILSISMVGYEKNENEKIVVNNTSNTISKKIVLKESSKMLNNVVVTAKKQFIEQTVDKMVINPEASPTTAGESVYDILKKLPGVTIDNSDNISLKGKEGVKVLIDEKPTYLTSDQLASMLKSMQGKNIDKIEIIENPSARYDAEGNSGIINIKTKHSKAPGFNGSANAGATFASRFGWNGGLDLNMNFGQLNIYGNYSYYKWDGWNTMDATRKFTGTQFAGAYQLIDNKGWYDGQSHNYKIGADYYISKNHVVSVMFRGNNGWNLNDDNSLTSFTDKNKVVDSTLTTVSHTDNRWNNQTYNVNYKWSIDTTGQSLTVDMDYARFYYQSPNNQHGVYSDPYGQSLNHDITVNTLQGSNINIYTAKADYVLPVNKVFNFEAGLKTSFVNTDSRISMEGYLTQNDHFIYQENIQAAYANGRAQFGKTTLQLGLRLENTISTGTSVTTNTVTQNNYLKLFPSLFVQQKLNDDNTFNLNYSYRIGRPSYHMLNPFRWMIDPYTYNVGNPNLKPQFTHSASIGHNFKNMFITTLGYNYTTELFTEIIGQDDASKTVYQTMENLNSSTDINLSETVQLSLFKWWSLRGTATGIYKKLNLFASTGSQIDLWSYNANLTNTISLPLKVEMELSGYYSSSQLISNIITYPHYSVDLGLQRRILKDNGMIKISLNDIFNTNNGGAYARYDNVNIAVMNRWDSRQLNVSFSYRFGKDNFRTRSDRSTASSEEERRSSK